MHISPGWQRAIGAAALVPAALALPIAATFLDQPPGRENWIIPAAAAGSIALGGGVGALMPAIFGPNMGRVGAAGLGAAIALGTAAAGTIAIHTLLDEV